MRVHTLAALTMLLTCVLAWGSVADAASVSEPDPVGVWPLQPTPEVVAGFDPPDGPWGAGHRGVDLRGTPGQVVHTALAGRVTYAGLLAGRGVVVVDHGDTRTTYEPVTAVVALGDLLDRGAVIGRLDAVGSHCPPLACLHWGWLRGETYLDPLGLVGAGPVRLLPLWRDEPVPAAPGLTPAILLVPTLPYAAVLRRLARLTSPRPATPPGPIVPWAGHRPTRADAPVGRPGAADRS